MGVVLPKPSSSVVSALIVVSLYAPGAGAACCGSIVFSLPFQVEHFSTVDHNVNIYMIKEFLTETQSTSMSTYLDLIHNV